MYSRTLEDFMADFCLVSRRVLDDLEYRLFQFHFLLGGDWKLCCRRLGWNRGRFFHKVYRVEEKLGRTFAELEPFSLYPLEEYFRSRVRKETPAAVGALNRRPPRHPKSA